MVERPEADTAVVALLGEHDLASAPELRRLLQSLRREPVATVVDLSETRFIDSAILHELLDAGTEAGSNATGFALQIGTEHVVWRVFQVTGIHERLPCAANRADAVRKARGEG